MALVNVHTHSFFEDLLAPGAIVLDLGANVGQFASAMTSRYDCRCVAIEPSPAAFASIAESAAIERHRIAVAGEAGLLTLNLSSNSEATSIGKASDFDYVGEISVPAVTLEQAFALAKRKRVDLLKLDIESAEIDVLNNSNPDLLLLFNQITVEFHDFCGMTSRDTVRKTVERVRNAGFYVFYFERTKYRYVDVLFVNRTQMGVLRYRLETLRWWVPRVFASLLRRLTGRGTPPIVTASQAP